MLTIKIVVIIANRRSDIGSCAGATVLADTGRVPRDGRHLRMLLIDARQGWIWRGYENMTRTTMAARPIVEAMDSLSVHTTN